MISDKKIFRSGLYADYLNLETKDEDVLYFCTDTKQIFKGTTDVTQEYQQVYNKPDDPTAGILYASSENGTVETYNGTSWVEVFAPIVGTDTVYSVPLPEGETSVNLPMPNEGDVVDIYTDNNAQYTSIEVNEPTRTRSGNNTGSLTVNFAQQEISDIVHLRTYHNDQYTASILSSLCIDSISITHPADNTVFINGEVLDITGLQVAAIQGSEQIDITNSITTIPAAGEKLKNTGNTIVRIIYGTLETSYNINVISINEIEVTTLPTKTSYSVGDRLDLTGIVVTGYANNRTVSKNITNNCVYSPTEGTVFDTEDTYNIAIRYRDLSTSFNVRVLPPVPEIYNTVRNASTVSELQWLEFVDSDCIKSVINREDTEAFIGKTVTISNSQSSGNTTYEILDFGHDNSGNTCDLAMIHTSIARTYAMPGGGYLSSYVYIWLNNEFLEGYSTDIKNRLITMDVVTCDSGSPKGTISKDKVKLLSATEIGATTNDITYKRYENEGTKYPGFNILPSKTQDTYRGKFEGGLRSSTTYTNGRIFRVYNNGTMSYDSSDSTKLIAPVIRFGFTPPNSLEEASWFSIKNALKNGSISDFANVGDIKTVKFNNGTGFRVQLVSINDGTGNAGEYYPAGTADFISYDIIPGLNRQELNSNSKGWLSCNFRTTLNEDFWNNNDYLPDTLKINIIPKARYYNCQNPNQRYDYNYTQYSSDLLWLPSCYEMCATDGTISSARHWSVENSNYCKHYSVFSSNNDADQSRIRYYDNAPSSYGYWINPFSVVGGYSEGTLIWADGKLDYTGTGSGYGLLCCFRIG